MLTTPHRKECIVTNYSKRSRTWTVPVVRTKQWERNMKLDTWNVRSLYRPDSLTAAARELARYILDLLGV